MRLRLAKSEILRRQIVSKQNQEIFRRYSEAQSKVNIASAKVTQKYGNTTPNIGAYVELEKEARKTYGDIVRNTEKSIKADMNKMADTTAKEFSDWLVSYNVPYAKNIIKIPKSVVNNIINGTVYQKPDNLNDSSFNWGLSKAIWGDDKKTLNDIHNVIATGVRNGSSAYDIGKDLEKYVKPGAKKAWSWSKVYPNTKKIIDYNAQRLARTLVSHAYQQMFKEAGNFNPWIQYFVWNSAFEHGRTCQVCMDLDGQRFAKDTDPNSPYPEMPIDHPNGLCWYTYEIDTTNMVDQLADWVNNPDASYPDIDAYMEYLKTR